MKEIELLDAFCNFLTREQFEFKREFRRGSYHNEGYIDVVLKSKINHQLIPIECKLNNFRTGLRQSAGNRCCFPLVYLLFNRIPTTHNLELLHRYNDCGIILPRDDKLQTFYVWYKPRESNYHYCSRHTWKIQRNWDENRIGRKIHAREIPENYDISKANALEPNYKWVFLAKNIKK